MTDRKPTILVVEAWSWVYSRDTFTDICMFLAANGYDVAYTTAQYAPSACQKFDCVVLKGNTRYRQTLSPDAPYNSSGLKLASDLREKGYSGHIIMATSHHDEKYFLEHASKSGVNALIPKDPNLVLEELQKRFKIA